MAREAELVAAVAAQRAQRIACEAFRVDSHQRRLTVEAPMHQRDLLAPVDPVAEGMGSEHSVVGRQGGGADQIE